ncbi:hypothetical protein T4B_8241 [Trichinella pseudospiralis]|uniref:Uncharacterized protein n=1 Tax=Trichinella pseudospiralis TaxID=6337 RepID=A0A0V1JFF5_TRIPS|nr:hypothetical protein T4B_8241 [Trichinella pseudospiralis]
MSMLSVALAQRGQLHDSLSTGVRRQTIKPPNRPNLHQPPHSLQLIGKYLINGMDLCGISDSKCKQRFQKRQSRLDNISNRLCQRLMTLFSAIDRHVPVLNYKPTNLIKVD